MKKLIINLSLILMIAALTGCAGTAAAAATSLVSDFTQSQSAAADETTTVEISTSVKTTVAEPVEADFNSNDLTVSTIGPDTVQITLEGNTASFDGSGVTVANGVVSITASGTYALEGTLNGQIVVITEDEEPVFIIMNGTDITNTTGSPVYIANAEKVVLTLAESTQNTLRDTDTYASLDESGEPDAALFSKDDLTINGSGELIVEANYNNGIACNDDLKIVSGEILVTSVNDGIKGKDSLSILNGTLTIIAGADGLEATNADEAEKGFILIEGGTLNIEAALDGIHAETSLQINGGTFNIITGGGAGNNSTDGGGIWGERGMEENTNKPAESAKGLKAGLGITISGGMISINAADDTIHSNGSIDIYGGEMTLNSGDDGMHADSALTINAGTITITQSYEGLESAVITINEGTVHVTASDDGINTGGGADNSATGGRSGQNSFNTSDGSWVYINGGTVYLNANGDGLDSNGSIEMTDGHVIVNGPTNDGNGPLDYMGTFNITGGFLIAVGSSGMAQAPSETSSQYAVLYNFDSQQEAGTLIHIQSENGEDILTFSPEKTYQSILFSTAELQNGETYVIYAGGSASASTTDGSFSDGSYTLGTEVASLTISSTITEGGMMGGGRPGEGRH